MREQWKTKMNVRMVLVQADESCNTLHVMIVRKITVCSKSLEDGQADDQGPGRTLNDTEAMFRSSMTEYSKTIRQAERAIASAEAVLAGGGLES